MKTIIERARKNLTKYVIEEPVHNLTESEKEIFIDKSKYAINNFNSYADISGYLADNLTDISDEGLEWNAIAFAADGGESSVFTKKYIRLLFDKLIIEIFAASG